jgi:3D (Asp-Asp-Asp) domain-containing protein
MKTTIVWPVALFALFLMGLLLFSSPPRIIPDEERLEDGRVVLSKERYRQLVVQAALCSDNATYFTDAYLSLQQAHIAEVRATAYSVSVAQCGKTDGITASGTRVRQDHTIAVSKDLWHLKGRRVRVVAGERDLGVFRVEDRMAHGKYRSVDIYMVGERDAARFGTLPATLIPI